MERRSRKRWRGEVGRLQVSCTGNIVNEDYYQQGYIREE